jgi:hypothetical protein
VKPCNMKFRMFSTDHDIPFSSAYNITSHLTSEHKMTPPRRQNITSPLALHITLHPPWPPLKGGKSVIMVLGFIQLLRIQYYLLAFSPKNLYFYRTIQVIDLIKDDQNVKNQPVGINISTIVLKRLFLFLTLRLV